MKKTNHLKLFSEMKQAHAHCVDRRKQSVDALDRFTLGQTTDQMFNLAVTQAKTAFESWKTLAKRWDRTSCDRVPERIERLYDEATKMADGIASLGERYSGETSRRVVWGDKASAQTQTSDGDRYSRSCKYSRTDATHTVTLDPYRVEHLIERKRLRELSAEDGLHLIALDPDGAAVWVKKHNKSLKSEAGWVIGDDICCYHSTISRDDAVKGHSKKRAMLDREKKADRRARLVARLCCNAKATIQDAKSLGYCDPGIAAFRERHNIGDTASLPELCRTGNPSAVRLALHLARKLAMKAAH